MINCSLKFEVIAIHQSHCHLITNTEEAVRHSNDDVERIKRKITEEEQAGILTYFENTRKETNDRMEFLTNDFEKMKNNCAEDIQLTGKA